MFFLRWKLILFNCGSSTVVGDYINTMKTTFELNFDLN